MDLLEAVQNGILATIWEEGVLSGVEAYKRDKELYSSLPPEEASELWSQILTCVKAKGNISRLSIATGEPSYDNSKVNIPNIKIVSEGDYCPGFDPDSLMGEHCKVVKDHCEVVLLEENVFDYALDALSNGLKLSASKWMWVYDNSCNSEYGVLEDSKLSFYQENMN